MQSRSWMYTPPQNLTSPCLDLSLKTLTKLAPLQGYLVVNNLRCVKNLDFPEQWQFWQFFQSFLSLGGILAFSSSSFPHLVIHLRPSSFTRPPHPCASFPASLQFPGRPKARTLLSIKAIHSLSWSLGLFLTLRSSAPNTTRLVSLKSSKWTWSLTRNNIHVLISISIFPYPLSSTERLSAPHCMTPMMRSSALWCTASTASLNYPYIAIRTYTSSIVDSGQYPQIRIHHALNRLMSSAETSGHSMYVKGLACLCRFFDEDMYVASGFFSEPVKPNANDTLLIKLVFC